MAIHSAKSTFACLPCLKTSDHFRVSSSCRCVPLHTAKKENQVAAPQTPHTLTSAGSDLLGSGSAAQHWQCWLRHQTLYFLLQQYRRLLLIVNQLSESLHRLLPSLYLIYLSIYLSIISLYPPTLTLSHQSKLTNSFSLVTIPNNKIVIFLYYINSYLSRWLTSSNKNQR